MDVAYQDDIYVDDRTIDATSSACVASSGGRNDFKAIETLYGVGYRFGEDVRTRDLRSAGRRFSLRQGIMAVNIFAILILAGSLFYPSTVSRSPDPAASTGRSEVVMISHMMAAIPRVAPAAAGPAGPGFRSRLRIYDRDGARAYR